jgi:CxxC motif-containing protein (DUF1111 family)
LNKYILTLFYLVLVIGCKPDNSLNSVDDDVQLGGETSIEGAFVKIFQQPSSNLNNAEISLHLDADKAFGDQFVTAPSSTINGGLGPVFNQNSCEGCHVSNGRSPFPTSQNDLRGLLFRISLDGKGSFGEPLKVPNFGGQLQTKAVFGKPAECKISWQESEKIKKYVDGTEVRLRQFSFIFSDFYAIFPQNVQYSARIAPPMIGLGLLEAINEADILANADPNDANNDGISGKPNRVWDFQKNEIALGRFGWKAGHPTLFQQTAAAYNDDMGVTNPLFKIESSYGQIQSDGLPDEPEIDLLTLQNATFYPQSLAVPIRRNWENAEVKLGKKLFIQIKCGNCHQPAFITGQHPEYAFLSNQTIFPYSDMLLHDMGTDLADNRPDFEANGQEWRTPPLWGVGLTKTVGGDFANYLHDGRARTLEEAIIWHGGEAENSRSQFEKLSKNERNALISFLENL